MEQQDIGGQDGHGEIPGEAGDMRGHIKRIADAIETIAKGPFDVRTNLLDADIEKLARALAGALTKPHPAPPPKESLLVDVLGEAPRVATASHRRLRGNP